MLLQIYISGNAFTILCDARTILQTIYDDDKKSLEAIALSESTGKIAACTSSEFRIYQPVRGPDRLYKVRNSPSPTGGVIMSSQD
jgi:hypothetical protein